MEHAPDAGDVTVDADEGAAAPNSSTDEPMLRALAAAAPAAEISTRSHVAGGRLDEATVPRDEYEACVAAAYDAGYTTFTDLCAVDYYSRDPRFEIVIQLIAMDQRRRLEIRVGVPGQDPMVASITGVFAGANFYEREAWDLFGIDFTGHPDLTRILMPDEWDGHPLRKDASVGSVPVQFKGAHKPA
jgi:NADH-quinone oxidoreductase subunit C